jgi:hypothetical protein
MFLVFAWGLIFVEQFDAGVAVSQNTISIRPVSRMFPTLVFFNQVASCLLNVAAGKLHFKYACRSLDKGERSAETQRNATIPSIYHDERQDEKAGRGRGVPRPN